MRYFVYGHTHLLEEAWRPDGVSYLQVLNSGAFQRVIDEKGFNNRVKLKGMPPGEGLRMIELEELSPCYTYIYFSYENGFLNPQVLRWVMRESDDTGRIVSPGDIACE